MINSPYWKYAPSVKLQTQTTWKAEDYRPTCNIQLGYDSSKTPSILIQKCRVARPIAIFILQSERKSEKQKRMGIQKI